MPKIAETTVIKKYANRRLYNTGTSMYVTLENLAAMVKDGEDFAVQDARTGEDITHSVLTQIIFEQENKVGQNMMPVAFLRQLIRFYGDQMQMVIPAYLEQSMAALSREQEAFRGGASDPVAHTTRLIEAQVRQNTEIFRQAMEMFNPFLAAATGETAAPQAARPAEARDDELAAMREQLAEMQRRIETIAPKRED